MSRASVIVTMPSLGSFTWFSSVEATISRIRTASRRARAWSATGNPSSSSMWDRDTGSVGVPEQLSPHGQQLNLGPLRR